MRLEAIIMELEREKNDVLIIAHETVLRCLYAYLFDRPESVSFFFFEGKKNINKSRNRNKQKTYLFIMYYGLANPKNHYSAWQAHYHYTICLWL